MILWGSYWIWIMFLCVLEMTGRTKQANKSSVKCRFLETCKGWYGNSPMTCFCNVNCVELTCYSYRNSTSSPHSSYLKIVPPLPIPHNVRPHSSFVFPRTASTTARGLPLLRLSAQAEREEQRASVLSRGFLVSGSTVSGLPEYYGGFWAQYHGNRFVGTARPVKYEKSRGRVLAQIRSWGPTGFNLVSRWGPFIVGPEVRTGSRVRCESYKPTKEETVILCCFFLCRNRVESERHAHIFAFAPPLHTS